MNDQPLILTEDAQRRYRHLGFLALAVIIGYKLAMVLALPLGQLVHYVYDDVLYYLKIGQNLAAGRGFTFDGLHQTNGFHPLWQLVCTLPHLLGIGLEWSYRLILTLNYLLAAYSLFLLHRLVNRRYGERTGLFVIICLSWPMIIHNIGSGMEMAIALPLLLTAVELADRHGLLRLDSHPRIEWAVGVLLGLVFLARLDTAFLHLTAGIYFLFSFIRDKQRHGGWSGFIRRGLRLFAPTLIALVGLLLWNQLTFGHLLPLSGSLKTSFPVPGFFYGNLLIFRELGILGLAALIWFAARHRRQGPLVGILAWGYLLFLAYNVFFIHWAAFPYYAVALGVPLLALFGGDVFATLFERRRWLRLSLTILAAAAVVAGHVISFSQRGADFHRAAYEGALWARRNTPPGTVFAMRDAGIFGYFSRRPTINLDGLVNDYDYQRVLAEGRLAEYFHNNRVEFFAHHALVSKGLESFTLELPSRLHGGGDSITVRADQRVFLSDPYSYIFDERVFWMGIYDIGQPGPFTSTDGN